MKKIVSILSTIFLLSAILSSCTDLEENPYSSIPSDEFFNNEEEFLMSAGRIYAYLVRYTCYRCIWGTISVSTDEAVSPLREGNQWRMARHARTHVEFADAGSANDLGVPFRRHFALQPDTL